MADLARALQTPVPATQPAPTTPQPAPTTIEDAQMQKLKAAKNERDRLRRKEKRAADLKAAQLAAAKPKKKAKRKAKKTTAARVDAALKKAGVRTTKKARGRGRPPGSKNKPKAGLAVALVPAPGVLPRVQKAPGVDGLLTQINLAVSLLNAMPEHARKVVLDAVK